MLELALRVDPLRAVAVGQLRADAVARALVAGRRRRQDEAGEALRLTESQVEVDTADAVAAPGEFGEGPERPRIAAWLEADLRPRHLPYLLAS